jgi:lysozyme
MMKPKRDVLDLSHWNTVDSFKAVYDSGVVGVIHKATQGTDFVDQQYYKRIVPAKAAGLLWGRYHFGTDENVSDQVERFLKHWTGDELLALDWENNIDGTMSAHQAEDFLGKVRQLTGVYAVLYSGSLLKEYMETKPYTNLPMHRLWWSQWTTNPVLPSGWDEAWLWQYTDSAHGPEPHGCPGITGNVDCNAYQGTREQLIEEWNGGEPPPLVA